MYPVIKNGQLKKVIEYDKSSTKGVACLVCEVPIRKFRNDCVYMSTKYTIRPSFGVLVACTTKALFVFMNACPAFPPASVAAALPAFALRDAPGLILVGSVGAVQHGGGEAALLHQEQEEGGACPQ